MEQPAAPKVSCRQWQVTLTEGPDPAVYRATVRWRTFPCRADEWHGARTGSVFSLGPRVGSIEDFQAVLSLFVDLDLEPLSRQASVAPPTTV